MKARSLHVAIVVAGAICLSASWAPAQDGLGKSIGLFTAAQGVVTVTHPGTYRVEPVNVHDEVLFKDVIETQHESRTKAFFEDDSILTIGEHSKVEITEYIYNPDQKVRRTVVKLLQGHLRALVSKVFTGSGSKFEIHTPTAVAAARGTYFVVWFENGMSGIANIGDHGRVGFTSGGTEIIVDPGRFSTALAGGVPSPPNVIGTGLADSGQNVQKAGEKIEQTEEKVTGKIQQTEEKVLGKVQQVEEKVTEKTQQTEEEWKKAAEKIQQTEEKVTEKTLQKEEEAAEKRVKRADKNHAAEIIERAEKREVEKLEHTKGKIDNRTATILARAMNAIEGTVLKDTPKRETAKDAIRAFHLAPHVSPLVSAIAKPAPGTKQTRTSKSNNIESDTTKEKPARGRNDNETAITQAMTEGSPTTSVIQSPGAGSAPAAPATSTGPGPMTGLATPSVNAAPTTVMPAAPAAPVVPVIPATPVVPVVPAAPAIAVVPVAPAIVVAPAAPIISVPAPTSVAPTVKVAPVTPPAVISGAIDHINREREHRNRGKK